MGWETLTVCMGEVFFRCYDFRSWFVELQSHQEDWLYIYKFTIYIYIYIVVTICATHYSKDQLW